MDELCARIDPHTTVLQLQCSMAHLSNRDARNIEIKRLSLDMQAVLCDSPAPLHELRIVLGRPIAGNYMDLPPAIDRFLYEIHMFQHAQIDGGNLSCMMAAHNMIHFVQRRQVVMTFAIAILDS